jgi:hypothetical protein
MMHTLMTARPHRALALPMLMLLCALALAGAAFAAPVTVTKTPKVVYLFVAVTPPAAGKSPFVELFHTDDQAACDAQAADWSARMAPNKFACLPHNQDKLQSDNNSGLD